MQVKNVKGGIVESGMVIVLSLLAGLIVAFFFVSVFLQEVAAIQITDSLMFVAPLIVGFLFGLMIADKEIHYILFSTLLITAFTIILVWMALFSPQVLGTGVMLAEFSGWAFKDLLLAGIITFPLTLASSIIGKYIGETTFYSTNLRQERDALKRETTEWYAMLERVESDKLKDKTEAPLEWTQTGAGHKPLEIPKKPEGKTD
ncbi:MAG: hypothetical protein V1934_03155 [Methanobacteriota archaeon]